MTLRTAPLTLLALLAACSRHSISVSPSDGTDLGGDPSVVVLSISPAHPVLTVVTGEPVPQVQFLAYLNSTPVDAQWGLNRGELGGIDEHGLFTPSTRLGGSATVHATVGSSTASTIVIVNLETTQSGAPPVTDPGAGGANGVGGEGPGPAPSPDVQAVLENTPQADAELGWLYPYDQTVFPLGVLGPLLQWRERADSVADGVRIRLTGAHYSYTGTFGRPPALAAGQPFLRHPIPQEAWDAATRSTAGDVLEVELLLAVGGQAVGPISQHWRIARGALHGVVYYQSYGTNLAKNFTGALGVPDGMFGGATLSIAPGATAPALVAGKDGGRADCRVCHTVSADGSRVVVQHGDDYPSSSSYDLKNASPETVYAVDTRGRLGWIGLYPDGSLGLSNGINLAAGTTGLTAGLFEMATGTEIPCQGLSTFVTQAGLPAFSPDGSMVAFNFFAGPGDATSGHGDGTKLVVMSFAKATATFSDPRVLYAGDAASRPAWPSFSPDGKWVLFEVIPPGNTSEPWYSRYGGKGQLWLSDVATGTARRLDRVNGLSDGASYLPTSADNHGDDTVLSYEPTVGPIASGGYAWVVFMSRRLYGSVATIDPWWSDPRDHDLSTTPTTKKLWIAAIDLEASTGDASHPAFYLPGQELLAGNSRGFWVASPCKPDGESCLGGDECCGGYCLQQEGGTALVCGSTSSGCANEFDRCVEDGDCCDTSLKCVNNMCTLWIEPPA